MRCAIYARYSSELQKPTSIEDQLRICKEWIQRKSWILLENHIYAEPEKTGRNLQREQLNALLAACKRKPVPFEYVVIDDTSRLGRKLRDTLKLSEIFHF